MSGGPAEVNDGAAGSPGRCVAARACARQGSALDLAVSRDLARGVIGDRTAESTRSDGSTVTLTLLVAAPDEG